MENEVKDFEKVIDEAVAIGATTEKSGNGFIGKAVIFGAGALTHAVGQIVVRKVKTKIQDIKANKEIKNDDCVVDFTTPN